LRFGSISSLRHANYHGHRLFQAILKRVKRTDAQLYSALAVRAQHGC